MTTINIFGDLVISGRARTVLDNQFENMLIGFTDHLKKSDFNIVNLESPLTESGERIRKVGPHLKSPPETIDLLSYCKFNIVTLANNHILDYGESGICDTIDLLDQHDILHVGAGENLSEALKPLILQGNGNQSIGILNFAEHEFSIATDQNYGASPLNPVQNHNLIKELKERVDHVLVIVHGGHEHYSYPSPRIQDTYRFFIDSGADVVAGHHPHCFSGHEKYNNGYIFYSLGNFIFDNKAKQNDQWNYGYGVSLKLDKNHVTFELIPYNQFSTAPVVYQLEGEELRHFEEDLQELNSVISNREKLRRKHEEYSLYRMNAIAPLFEPYENRFLRALRRRGYLPSMLRVDKYLKIYNYIMCESHKDLVEYMLLKKIKKR